MLRFLPSRCVFVGSVACSLLMACGSSSSSSTGSGSGSTATGGFGSLSGTTSTTVTPEIAAFSHLTNALPVYVTVDGASAWAFVDTGNPWVVLDPTAFPGVASLPTNGADVPTLDVGGTTVNEVYVIASAAADINNEPPFTLEGNLGCTVVCAYAASFNYRDALFSLNATAPPSGLGADTALDFELAGGATEEGVPSQPSRIIVAVTIEGHDYTMMVDTGATSIVVSQSVYSTLTADGRTQLNGGTVETTSGTSSSSTTRVASVVVGGVGGVGGVEVDNVVVAHDTSFDSNLANVSDDAGETIDGSLGGTFLHNFYVTVDYPNKKLHLAPYTDLTFAIDPAELIGITLGTLAGGGYGVATVSTDASAVGVEVDDEIVAIDGETLSSLSVYEVAALLYGQVGATKQVTFGDAATLSNQTITLPVENQLPLNP